MKLNLMSAALVSAGILASPQLLADAAKLSACCTPGDKDFPTHGGNLGNQRYSALTQIDQANVKKLGPVW